MAVEIVNRVLSQDATPPRLVGHGERDWHLDAVPRHAPWSTRIRVETAMAMVEVIRAGELSRLGTCAGHGCEGVVLDLSRNRSRRFCSTVCANRGAVAAYRTRRASG
jgi:predicted RNA-binding Zn ribbon-like protein